MRDAERDALAFFDSLAALDTDRDELGRALAVPDDRLRQLDGDASIAARIGAMRGSAADVIGGMAPPVAASTKLSLVDVSPSTVAPLNETSATSRAMLRSSGAAIGASVAMNASIVAMSGWIIPEPFAMPVTVTGTPPTSTRRDAPFGTVSVVMIALRGGEPPVGARRAPRGRQCAEDAVDGSGSMMTPVE